MLKGIDISHHNGRIDFSIVKNEIDFIILKLGNIGDNKKFWLDDKFEYYYNECKKYKIPIDEYDKNYYPHITIFRDDDIDKLEMMFNRIEELINKGYIEKLKYTKYKIISHPWE